MPTYRDIAKAYLVTGAKPTQAQFAQIMDSLFFKDEGINMSAVAGLLAALTGKAGKNEFDSFYGGELITASADVVYMQLANYLLEKVIIIPGADAVMRIGTTNGGQEIMNDTSITVADITSHTQIIDAFTQVDRNIYINGITANSKIIIIKRLIKTI